MKLIEMSLSAGLLIVLIVVVRAVAINKIPKTAFLVLWGVVLARLLIPMSIAIPGILPLSFVENNFTQTFNEVGNVSGGCLAMTTHFIPGIYDVAARIASGLDFGQHAPTMILAWALGAAGLAAYWLILLRHSRKMLRTALPMRRMDVRIWGNHKARVYVSDRVSTPLTYGLFRPRIVLPRRAQFESRAQLKCVLAHETVHIRRMDILWRSLLLVAICLHWFNPMVWVMYFLACRDVELSCDERVLKHMDTDGRRIYAMTLIHCEEQRTAAVPLSMAFCKNSVEERIVSIMKYKKRSRVGVAVAVAMLVVSLSVFAMGDSPLIPVATVAPLTELSITEPIYPANPAVQYASAAHTSRVVMVDAAVSIAPSETITISVPAALIPASTAESTVLHAIPASVQATSVEAAQMTVRDVQTIELQPILEYTTDLTATPITTIQVKPLQ